MYLYEAKIDLLIVIYFYIHIYYMIIIFIIVVMILVFKNLSQLTEFFSYRLCKKRYVKGLHGKLLKKNNFVRTNNNDWDLYLPCGYKYVEGEITKLNLNNKKNKYIFGISGSDQIASKNNLWKILKNYYGFSDACDIMPTTYILNDPSDMILFKKNYKPDKSYILKKNLQRKKGLKLMKNDDNIISYANKHKYKVIQEYIENPFLVNGYKLNIRVFMLVVCSNNTKKIYMHKSGKCLYTSKKYKNNLVFHNNITSYYSNKSIYNTNPLSLEQLRMYLNNNNISDVVVINRIRFVMVKLANAIRNVLCKKSVLNNVTTFQLFGIDIILDNKLRPLILEINKGPNMIPVNNADKKLKETIYKDVYNNVNIINSPFNGFDEL